MRACAFLLLGAALAGPASATVLLDESGVLNQETYYNFSWDPFDPARVYHLSIRAEQPIFALAHIELGFCYEEYRDGNLENQFCDDYWDDVPLGESAHLAVRFETAGYNIRPESCDPEYRCFFWTWENLEGLYLSALDKGPVRYHVRLVQADVPEPAAWALMIAGFGLVGATARRRNRAVQ